MSGILDNKSRVMDTIMTLEGRRQIANAKLKIEYVSFTDNMTYYAADVASGSADATTRIYFEQCHLPQDQISFEADDSGRLQSFNVSDDLAINNGQIVAYSFAPLTSSLLTGSSQNMYVLQGEEFASTAESILASSFDNFDRLRLIGTKDAVFEDDGFGVGNQQIQFVVNDERPLPDVSSHIVNVNYEESLFQDVRLSNVDNFKFLPPLNKVDDSSIDKKDHRNTTKYQLGCYAPWGRSHVYGLSPNQLMQELSYYGRMGYVKTVVFDPTSLKNSLMGQFFELNGDMMKKLDIIDYGSYTWNGQRYRAFFAGKVMIDDNGSHTFIHIFTLVFG